MQSEQLRRELSSVLERLVRVHDSSGHYAGALKYARRWLSQDPLEEAAQRALIRLYALNGQQASAIRQYRECLRILKNELNVEPEEETTVLYEAVIAKRLKRPLLKSSQEPAETEQTISDLMTDELRLMTVVSINVSPILDSAWNQYSIEAIERTSGFLYRIRELLSGQGAHVLRESRDTLLAVYGWPYTHEDDAEKGVRSAVQILEQAEENGLSAAAGVDTGIIYADPGESADQSLTLTGAAARRWAAPPAREGMVRT